MRVIRDSLVMLCLSLLIFVLAVVAWHAPRWARTVDKTLLHVDEFAGEGKIAMKNLAASSVESKKSAQVISQELPVLIDQAHGSLAKINTLLDSADVAVHSTTNVLNSAQITVETANATLGNVDYRLGTLTDSMDSTLLQSRVTMETFNQTLTSVRGYIDGPLTSTTKEARDALVPVQWTAYDFQQKAHEWLYPVREKKRFGVLRAGWSVARGLSPFAQPSYYAVRIVKGE